MGVLSREIQAVQNPALGAALQWRGCCGYVQHNSTAAPMPLPLVFLILPIVLHEETATLLLATRSGSGLRKFIEKFSLASNSQTDLILAVTPRALAMRTLSIDAVRLAISHSLFNIDPTSGGVFPLSTTAPRLGIPSSIRPLLLASERLGAWLGQISPYEAAVDLRVRF
jgi:hypothetical protein